MSPKGAFQKMTHQIKCSIWTDETAGKRAQGPPYGFIYVLSLCPILLMCVYDDSVVCLSNTAKPHLNRLA